MPGIESRREIGIEWREDNEKRMDSMALFPKIPEIAFRPREDTLSVSPSSIQTGDNSFLKRILCF